MINSKVILQCILILSAFTLFYTYKNDFNVFLLTLLLIISALWCYTFINELTNNWSNKINKTVENIENIVGNRASVLTDRLLNN
jgi:ABC-type transport system involved in multi-copper enzyme maturation permease subunit